MRDRLGRWPPIRLRGALVVRIGDPDRLEGIGRTWEFT